MNKNLSYPIGQFEMPSVIDESVLQQWIETIAVFPANLKAITEGLSTTVLNWRYRPEGWTIKQVVHHCGDSHINSFVRYKLALTEIEPTIRPYFEERWAELIDGLDDDISDSLLLITALHRKWAKVLNNMTTNDFDKAFIHPEHGKRFTLREATGMYAWHCRHHLAHIEQALALKGV